MLHHTKCFFGFFVLAVWVISPQPGTAKPLPYTPSSDDQVLKQVRPAEDPALQELRTLEGAWRDRPDQLDSAVALSRQLVTLGRGSADQRYLGYAETVLAPWTSRTDMPSDVRLLRAIIRQWDHQFKDALMDLDIVLQNNPRLPQARLSRAFVRQAIGDASGGLQDCEYLPDGKNAFVKTACKARMLGLTGQAEAAYALLSGALSRQKDLPPATSVWARRILADIARRLGRRDDADRHFKAAFGVQPDNTAILADYADFLLATNRAAAVLDLIEPETKPYGLLLRRAIAARQLGLDDDPAAIAIGQQQSGSTGPGQRRHLRDRALFALDLQQDSVRALTAASENWSIQREPEDARLFLRTAIDAGRSDLVEPLVQWVRSTRLQDVEFQELADGISRNTNHDL